MQSYNEIFFGPVPNKKRWLIINLSKADNSFLHSRLSMSILRIMAEERKDTDWRFGVWYAEEGDGYEFMMLSDTYAIPNAFIVEPDENGVNWLKEGPGLMTQYEGLIRWIDDEDGIWREKFEYRPPRAMPKRLWGFQEFLMHHVRDFHLWYISEGEN